MNIYGFMIVKDEEDIICQTLESLSKYGGFSKIFIFDNRSTDGTRKLAQHFKSDKIIVLDINQNFSDNLKYENVYHHANIFNDGDWFAILDADEVYQESLPPLIDAAELEHANYIESRSAQFYFTESDSSYDFDPSVPASQQRPFYLLNYGEPRVFRYSNQFILTADLVKRKDQVLIGCSKQLLIHHIQFRSSQQTQHRLDVRLANHVHSKNWGHINSMKWQDYIVPSRHLHRYDGVIKTGLPHHANLYKIRDNTAYTMANLNWLRKFNYLTEDQLAFFAASRLQRLVRKLW